MFYVKMNYKSVFFFGGQYKKLQIEINDKNNDGRIPTYLKYKNCILMKTYDYFYPRLCNKLDHKLVAQGS